jgi:hypothetical protein
MGTGRILMLDDKLIIKYLLKNDYLTYDPYDLWKTSIGFSVKKLFNCNRHAGFFPAAVLTIFDSFLNNHLRLFYEQQEYPVVRAFAALILLNLYHKNKEQRYLNFVKKHLQWLASNPSKGYNGFGWGLNFNHPVSCKVIYDRHTPFSTITPYVLEAFIQYENITGDKQFDVIIKNIYDFFDKDIKIMAESEDYLITSYGPMPDRIVINAVSYTMFSYCLLLPYVAIEQRDFLKTKIHKLYVYIIKNQKDDGSWLYSPQGNSFIDCFHSCIVLKNLIKANRIVELNACQEIVKKGYSYLRNNFLDERYWLFKRFSLQNKPSIVKFDLYDNAEALNLAWLVKDDQLVDKLSNSIRQYFCNGLNIYSQVDLFGIKRNKNMLRWAVMPYLYALSQMNIKKEKLK